MSDVIQPLNNPPALFSLNNSEELKSLLKKVINTWTSKILIAVGVFLVAKGIISQEQVTTITDPKMVELISGAILTCVSLTLDIFRYKK